MAAIAIAFAAVPAAAFANHASLVAQWSLKSQTAGTTPEASGHNLTGVDFAGAIAGGGRFGNALTMAGAPQGFRVANDPLLEPEQLTVVAWAKKGAPFDPYRQIVGKGGRSCSDSSYIL